MALSTLCAKFVCFSLLTLQVMGVYVKLSEKKGIDEAFDKYRSSFDFQKNWQYCTRGTVEIKFVEGKKDYLEDFETAFKMLEKENGGSIKLGKGTYEVSGPITMPEKCCIRGAGMRKTTIRLQDKARAPFPSGKKGVLHCTKSRYVSDGNRENQHGDHKYLTHGRYGISFERCNYAWFRNVRATNNQLYGFFVRGIRDSSGYHALFEAVQADGNGLDGMKFRSFMYASVSNSIVRDNDRNGVFITGRSGKILLYNNRISKNGRCGYRSESEKGDAPNQVRIENTTVKESSEAGMCVIRGNETVIKATAVYSTKSANKSKGACYEIDTSCRVTFDSSKCVGTQFQGKLAGSNCEEGVMERGVCCALSCGECGGRKCSKRGRCCVSGVKRPCKQGGTLPCKL